MIRRLRYFIVLLFLVALVFMFVYGYQRHPVVDEALQPPPEPIKEVTVTLFFSDAFAQCLVAETRTLPAGEDLPLRILQALGEGPRSAELVGTIPQGARVLSVTVENGLAVVDYSEELRSNHPGGSAGELLTAYAIVGSLAALDEVEAVQILLEGRVIDSLVGHLIFSEPMTVSAEALASGKICW